MTAGWFNKGVAFSIMYRIMHELQYMSVKQFVASMSEYGSLHDSVIVEGVWNGDRVRGRVWELAETNIAILCASSVKCRFFGGPPGNRTYYTGSLLTMLMDRVMSAAIENGLKAAKPLFPNERLTTG
jgi:hypothetical protein